MSLVVLFLGAFALVGLNSAQGAPIDGQEEAPSGEYEETSDNNLLSTRNFDEPLRAASTEKNPVQEWFENLSKNTSTNAQNAMNTLKDWMTKLAEGAQNLNNRPAVQETPTVYMGSFQLVKMPMPQFDIMKGIGDLATAAQTFNKVTGLGNNLIPQGIPLLSQG